MAATMTLPQPRDLAELLALEPHGPDTFVAVSPPYEWGRIYGGQVIAQALRAASATVDSEHGVHSLHAYFILGGRLDEPVRYEVDRVRNGRSFLTRRVVARQSYGAILTLEASFHAAEPGPAVQTIAAPGDVPPPEGLPEEGWGWMLERRNVPHPHGRGRVLTWVRVDATVGLDPIMQTCALALASDTSAVSAVRDAHPRGDVTREEHSKVFMGASLDHAVWFHHPTRADDWLLLDFHCQFVGGARGLSFGHVFDRAGRHVATIVQEALLRERDPAAAGPGVSEPD
jgi:acyl-CoA thioesterase-2